MKQIFEKGGILAQIPVLLFVLIYFPAHGTDMYDKPVHVTASFYWIQVLMCVVPIIQHFLFMNQKDKYDTGTQWNILRVFYIVSFFLTVWNCMRFQ
jgi:hypothetical protein